MTNDVITKVKAQMLAIATTAALGAGIALAQGFLEAHGLSCNVQTSPALAAGSGAFLKAVHTAIIGTSRVDA